MHTYKAAGTYTVSIYGGFSQIYLPYYLPENSLKLQSIEQWGDIRWESMRGAFSGATNMVYRATDAPDLSAVTDTSEMFMFALRFNGDLSNWNVSSVTDVSSMFSIARAFNGDISSWNVSGMTDMSNMLDGTNDFAWNLGDWYIVLDDTTMSDANETLAISAQNAYLDGQNPTYVVDDANFAVVDGALAVKPGQSVPPGTYNVTVTVGGVIGEVVNTSHSRTVQVTMEGDVAQPTILSTAYLTGNGTLTVTFSEPLNGTIRYDRLHVRDAGQLSDGISLDEAQDKHSSGSAVTVLLAAQQRADFAKMVAPQLNVDHGAVFDVSGNGVAAAIRPVDTIAAVAGAGAFVTTWTVGAGDSITIPVGGSAATYNIDWGDGTVEMGVAGDRTHTYDLGGNYTVLISDDFERIHLNDHQAASRLASIDQWGDAQWTSMESAFAGTSNMVYGATDTPDLSAVTDTSEMFSGATSFNGDISDWNTSSVTGMESMFSGATSFNGDISDWNVSSVTDMIEMFDGASGFAQNLGNWYIVLDNTVISDASETLAISAQNAYLDGQNPTYAVDDATGNGALFEVASGDLAIKSGQNPASGSYNITITSTGSFGTDNSRVVEIAVSIAQANNPPVADAGNAQTVLEGSTVTLNGTASDTDGGTLTYLWSHDSNMNITFSDPSSLPTSFTAPQVDSDTTVTITLTVSDGNSTVSDSVDVTVTDSADTAPTVDAGDDREYAEGSTISLNATVTDPDTEDSLEYAWSHNSTLSITLDDIEDPSFTAPNVAEDTPVLFTLTVSDNTATVTDTVTVTITDSPNTAPTVDAGDDREYAEGSTISLNATVTDPDTEDSLEYAWSHNSTLSITLDDIEDPSFTAPNVAEDTPVLFTLTVSDNTDTVTDTVTVTITDSPNTAPTVDAGDDREYAEGSTISLNATVTDPDTEDSLEYAWSHNSTLSITLDDIEDPSFTAPNVAEDTPVLFTLEVSDNTATVTDTVTVTITDSPNTAPTVDAGDDREYAEGSTISLNATVTDPDTEDTLDVRLVAQLDALHHA